MTLPETTGDVRAFTVAVVGELDTDKSGLIRRLATGKNAPRALCDYQNYVGTDTRELHSVALEQHDMYVRIVSKILSTHAYDMPTTKLTFKSKCGQTFEFTVCAGGLDTVPDMARTLDGIVVLWNNRSTQIHRAKRLAEETAFAATNCVVFSENCTEAVATRAQQTGEPYLLTQSGINCHAPFEQLARILTGDSELMFHV